MVMSSKILQLLFGLFYVFNGLTNCGGTVFMLELCRKPNNEAMTSPLNK